MTNGFMPQQTNGTQPQFAQPQQPTPQYQQGMGVAPGNFVPAQQPQQTGGYFNQPQPGNTPPQFAQPTPAQMPQQYQPPAEPASVEDTAGFFGGGAAYISWDSEKGYRDGSPRGGLIIAKRYADQTDMDTGEVLMSKYQQGKPRQQLVITLQTGERVDPDDDGQRQLVVKSGLRKSAQQAFEAVGAKDLEIGGWFYAARIRKEPIPDSKYKRNVFSSVYARPGSPDPMAGQPVYQAPTPPSAAYAPQAQQNFAPPQPSQFTQAAAPELAQMPNPVMAAYQQQPGQFPQQAPAGQFVPGAQVAQGDIGHQVHGFAPQQLAQPQQPGFQPGAQQNGFAPTTPGADPQQQPGQWSPFSS